MSIQYGPDLLCEQSDPDLGCEGGRIVHRLLRPNQPTQEQSRHQTSQKPKDHNSYLPLEISVFSRICLGACAAEIDLLRKR